MNPQQQAAEIAKQMNYDTDAIFDLTLVLLEEINFRREAAKLREMLSEEIAE